MENKKPTSKDIQQEVKKGAIALQQMLRSPLAEDALNFLTQVFDGQSPFKAGDPYETHVNIGRQEVIRYLNTVKDSEHSYE